MCFFLFFFFKQKTAYEMRISDWSSDVCSSDLVPRQLGIDERALDQMTAARGISLPFKAALAVRVAQQREVIALGRRGRAGGDRKSVVEGKSVSVRVDLGGSLILKNKTKPIYMYRSTDIYCNRIISKQSN